MRNVIVYVDGFNLYHAIDKLGQSSLKWLDLWLLAETLLRPNEKIAGVKYFTAHATWRPTSLRKHRSYVSALRTRGVEVILGQFKEKPRRCVTCRSQWMGHEEKETDVQIAVHMVSDALLGKVDRLILISADTDLSPPIKMIAAHAPQCEVFVATPPGRFGICRALGPKLEVSRGRIARSLLPMSIQLSASQSIECPIDWR